MERVFSCETLFCLEVMNFSVFNVKEHPDSPVYFRVDTPVYHKTGIRILKMKLYK